MAFDLNNFDAAAGQTTQGDTAVPRFYVAPKHMMALSEKEGRAIYEDCAMVEIRHPGDRTYSMIQEVAEEHKKRWPQHYAAFKAGQEAPLDGTAIELWPVLTPSQVLNLKAMHIRTIEDFATIPDGGLSRLGHGALDLRTKALAWLANARDSAGAMRAASEAEKVRLENDQLRAQLAELSARMDASESKSSRKTLKLADAE